MPKQSNSTEDLVSQNLRSLCTASTLTIPQIADLAGVSERTLRGHLQSSESVKISTLSNYALVLDVEVEQLLTANTDPARRQYLIGHPPLDQIIRAIIQAENNEVAQSIAGRYVDPNYICTSSRYNSGFKHTFPYDPDGLRGGSNWAQREANPPSLNVPPHGMAQLWGITWDVECKLNEDLLDDRNLIKIDRAIIVGAHQVLVVQDGTKATTQYPKRGLVTTTTANTKTLIQLYFQNKITDSIVDEDTYPWALTRKHWERLEATETHETQMISPI